MIKPIPFGARSTADKVLAGIDLTGKRIVVTGCNSGLGFETMNALSANGAQVIGLAKSLRGAKTACDKAGPSCIPVACDLADLDFVAAAAGAIRALQVPLDAVVANAGIANLPTPQIRYGVDMQFRRSFELGERARICDQTTAHRCNWRRAAQHISRRCRIAACPKVWFLPSPPAEVRPAGRR